MKRIHYMDNASTTVTCPPAAEAAVSAMTGHYGNPSSLHGLGIDAERLVTDARMKIAGLLGSAKNELIFTSGGTESNNWAVFAAIRLKRRGHVISSAAEHHSVLEPVRAMEQQGFEVTLLKPDKTGAVSSEAFAEAIRPDTVFASVMAVNNETGAVSNVRKMADILKKNKPDALFHTDAVQAFMKTELKASKNIDFVSVSAHKLHAPKGVGALYVRNGLNIPPMLRGGGQERGLRAGTEAVPLIAAFGAACSFLAGNEALHRHTEDVSSYARELLESVPGLVMLSGGASVPGILCLSIPGLKSEVTIHFLEERGVYVSSGAACAKGRRSHVLEAMGLPSAVMDGALRASFSVFSERADVDALFEGLLESKRRFL